MEIKKKNLFFFFFFFFFHRYPSPSPFTDFKSIRIVIRELLSELYPRL
jgi:hypothetical protein